MSACVEPILCCKNHWDLKQVIFSLFITTMCLPTAVLLIRCYSYLKSIQKCLLEMKIMISEHVIYAKNGGKLLKIIVIVRVIKHTKDNSIV